MDGDAMVMTFNDPVKTARHCGTCTLCCRLLPVPPLNKPGGTRCQHQRHGKGCAIYPRRPDACRIWSCRWLSEPGETAMLRRPDHAHYVIDLFFDRVTVVDIATGARNVAAAVQIWVDPAHIATVKRDPALRAYLIHMAEEPRRMAAILRYGPREGVILAAPSLSASGDWYEDPNPTISSAEFSRLKGNLIRPDIGAGR